MDAEWLAGQIKEQVGQFDAREAERDRHGARYVVDIDLKHAARTGRIRTAWIVRSGEDFPRLATCYVLRGLK